MSKKLYIDFKKKYIEQKGGMMRSSFKPMVLNNNLLNNNLLNNNLLNNNLVVEKSMNNKNNTTIDIYAIRHGQTFRNESFYEKVKDFFSSSYQRSENELSKVYQKYYKNETELLQAYKNKEFINPHQQLLSDKGKIYSLLEDKTFKNIIHKSLNNNNSIGEKSNTKIIVITTELIRTAQTSYLGFRHFLNYDNIDIDFYHTPYFSEHIQISDSLILSKGYNIPFSVQSRYRSENNFQNINENEDDIEEIKDYNQKELENVLQNSNLKNPNNTLQNFKDQIYDKLNYQKKRELISYIQNKRDNTYKKNFFKKLKKKITQNLEYSHHRKTNILNHAYDFLFHDFISELQKNKEKMNSTTIHDFLVEQLFCTKFDKSKLKLLEKNELIDNTIKDEEIINIYNEIYNLGPNNDTENDDNDEIKEDINGIIENINFNDNNTDDKTFDNIQIFIFCHGDLLKELLKKKEVLNNACYKLDETNLQESIMVNEDNFNKNVDETKNIDNNEHISDNSDDEQDNPKDQSWLLLEPEHKKSNENNSENKNFGNISPISVSSYTTENNSENENF